MNVLYYRDNSGDNIVVILNEDDAWAATVRSGKSPVPASLAEFRGTKISRDSAVQLVGEDHVVSAENYVRNTGGSTVGKP